MAKEASWSSSEAVRASMRGNRSRNTQPEIALRSVVHRRGLRFRVNDRPIPDWRRTADLVFKTQRVAVFLDGCYWHGCPDHYRPPTTNPDYWSAKLERNRARDREVDSVLTSAGWTVIRIWEHEDVEVAADIIEEAVRGRRSGHPDLVT